MNIWALPGHKVTVTEESKGCGWDHDKKMVDDILEVGKVYTIAKTDVSRSATRVFLEEFPGKCFNSVNFEDHVKQSKYQDRKHEQWSYYMKRD